MRLSPLVTCCWPGLSRVWFRGSWRALGLSIGFGLVLNVLIVASFVWVEWIGRNWRLSGWGILATFWAGSAAIDIIRVRPWNRTIEGFSGQDLLPAALDEYLKGDYYATEKLLRRMLDHRSEDVEVRLMLATLLRRCGRVDEARDELANVNGREAAERWKPEIQAEIGLLDLAVAEELSEGELLPSDETQPVSTAA